MWSNVEALEMQDHVRVREGGTERAERVGSGFLASRVKYIDSIFDNRESGEVRDW
jgi:hypothetical protein